MKHLIIFHFQILDLMMLLPLLFSLIYAILILFYSSPPFHSFPICSSSLSQLKHVIFPFTFVISLLNVY